MNRTEHVSWTNCTFTFLLSTFFLSPLGNEKAMNERVRWRPFVISDTFPHTQRRKGQSCSSSQSRLVAFFSQKFWCAILLFSWLSWGKLPLDSPRCHFLQKFEDCVLWSLSLWLYFDRDGFGHKIQLLAAIVTEKWCLVTRTKESQATASFFFFLWLCPPPSKFNRLLPGPASFMKANKAKSKDFLSLWQSLFRFRADKKSWHESEEHTTMTENKTVSVICFSVSLSVWRAQLVREARNDPFCVSNLPRIVRSWQQELSNICKALQGNQSWCDWLFAFKGHSDRLWVSGMHCNLEWIAMAVGWNHWQEAEAYRHISMASEEKVWLQIDLKTQPYYFLSSLIGFWSRRYHSPDPRPQRGHGNDGHQWWWWVSTSFQKDRCLCLQCDRDPFQVWQWEPLWTRFRPMLTLLFFQDFRTRLVH